MSEAYGSVKRACLVARIWRLERVPEKQAMDFAGLSVRGPLEFNVPRAAMGESTFGDAVDGAAGVARKLVRWVRGRNNPTALPNAGTRSVGLTSTPWGGNNTNSLPASLSMAQKSSEASGGTVAQLQEAKSRSDKRDYVRKHAILKRLLEVHGDEFKVDSRKGNIVGLTHTPSNFRIHAPSNVVPMGMKMAAQAAAPTAAAQPLFSIDGVHEDFAREGNGRLDRPGHAYLDKSPELTRLGYPSGRVTLAGGINIEDPATATSVSNKLVSLGVPAHHVPEIYSSRRPVSTNHTKALIASRLNDKYVPAASNRLSSVWGELPVSVQQDAARLEYTGGRSPNTYRLMRAGDYGAAADEVRKNKFPKGTKAIASRMSSNLTAFARTKAEAAKATNATPAAVAPPR